MAANAGVDNRSSYSAETMDAPIDHLDEVQNALRSATLNNSEDKATVPRKKECTSYPNQDDGNNFLPNLWGSTIVGSSQRSRIPESVMETVNERDKSDSSITTENAMSPVSIMLRRIASSDAHFKHQQRGEPDLTYDEKYEIAESIFNRNPTNFLARFGKHVVDEDLMVFEALKNDYEVGFHLKEIRKRLDDRTNEMKKRNRRFEAMKKMTEQGEYFDEESMKSRDPLLYEQMIGRYLTDEQVSAQVSDRDLGFSSVLMHHVQALQNTALYNHLKDIEDGQKEESEESEEEDMDCIDAQEKNEEELSTLDQQMLRNEFLRTMQLRFLNGEDTEHFDYRLVDENEEFDSLDIRTHDEQESYFDHDEDEDYFVTDRHLGRSKFSRYSHSRNAEGYLENYRTSENSQFGSSKPTIINSHHDGAQTKAYNEDETSEYGTSSACLEAVQDFNEKDKTQTVQDENCDNDKQTCDSFHISLGNEEDTNVCVANAQFSSTESCSGLNVSIDSDVDYEDYVVAQDVCPGLQQPEPT